MDSVEGTVLGGNLGQVRQDHSGETEQDMFTHECTLYLAHFPLLGQDSWLTLGWPSGSKSREGTY